MQWCGLRAAAGSNTLYQSQRSLGSGLCARCVRGNVAPRHWPSYALEKGFLHPCHTTVTYIVGGELFNAM